MKNPLLKPKVVDYSKVERKLKKNIPEITQEEIDEIISSIPCTMPMALVTSMILLLKATYKNPKKLDDLKKLDPMQVMQNAEEKIDPLQVMQGAEEMVADDEEW